MEKLKTTTKLMAIFFIVAIFAISCGGDDDEPLKFNIELTVTPDNGNVKIYATAPKLIVDWGDGSKIEYSNVTEIFHTYSNNNTYTVKIAEEGLTEFGDKLYFDLNGELSSINRLAGNIRQINIIGCSGLAIISITQNTLTGIEINNCPALTILYCSGNQLTTLNVSDVRTSLAHLECSYNNLTKLDVSDYTALVDLVCGDNQLTTLNVSGCTTLNDLYCNENQLITLNVNGCIALNSIYCSFNKLTSLDVSGHTALAHLECIRNKLTTLNVSGCTALISLYCFENQLTTVNISGCTTTLTQLYCQDNLLTASAIDAVFTDLPDRMLVVGGSIDIRVNYGRADCTPSIAENKNWYVIR
jgi:Leucine-rich repeat (LRR) protein